MLGWFKKKFGKQPEEKSPEAQEPQVVPQVEPELLPSAQVPQPEAVAEKAVAPEEEEREPATPQPAAMVAAEEPAATAAPVVPVRDQEPAEPVRTVPEVLEPAVQEPPEEAVVAGDADAAPPAEAEEACSVETMTAPVEAPTLAELEPAPEGDDETPEIATEEIADSEVEAAPGAQPSEGPDEQLNAEVQVLATGKTQEKPKGKSLFQRLQERLGKTRDAMVYRLDRLFLGKKEIDQDLFEQLEEILIMADLGVATTLELIDVARKKVKRDQLRDPQALKEIIREQILAYIEASEQPAELVMPEQGPFVIMVVGVNGVGKTTTIGKLAAKFVRSGQSVLLVAGDTFRAAAINQLSIWAERVGVEIVAQKPGADPSSVVFDGLTRGMAHGHDVIIIDTAGRLHTSVNLMEELKKIKRVIGKKLADAPHEILLVLDATTGQNGISQAKLFHEAVGVTGLTLTKLDGTAKGGIVANICRETKIPVRFIGIGEQIDDLRDFDAREFVEALFTSQPH